MNDNEVYAEKKRIASIDFMKGFAMVCVILCHAIQRAGCREQYIVLWKIIYAWHMSIFFLISGFCANHDKKFLVFLKEKALRLLYPWFIWRFLEWLFRPFSFSGFAGFDSGMPHEFKDFLLFYIKSPFRPMWFLLDLFIFGFVIFLLSKIKAKKINTFANILLCIMVILFRDYLSTSGWAWSYLAYDLQFFVYFVIGCEIKKYKDYLRNFKVYGIGGAMVLSVLLGLAIVFLPGSYYFEIVRALCCSFGIMLIGEFVTGRKGLISFVEFMGIHSLEFYTTQFICLNAGMGTGLIRVVSNFVCCIFIITAIIQIAQKIPFCETLLWGKINGKRKTEETICR